MDIEREEQKVGVIFKGKIAAGASDSPQVEGGRQGNVTDDEGGDGGAERSVGKQASSVKSGGTSPAKDKKKRKKRQSG